MDNWDVIVVGAGPAGLLAACRAAERGRRTLLLEKNARPGAKILISGGGHCNLTQATDARGIIEAFGPPGRFLHSALAVLGPQDLIDLVEAEGVPTTVEPARFTKKVFPASGRAGDVLAALLRRLRRCTAVLAADEPLLNLERHEGGFRLATSRRTLTCGKVVLTTGGQSYPGCGTTGDGYRWAASLGHTIVPPRPALVPVVTDAAWVKKLQGITVPDVLVQVPASETSTPPDAPLPKRPRPAAKARGSMLFAHFGLSGPVVLDVSRRISGQPRGRRPALLCDFLPDVKQEEVEAVLAAGAIEAGRRHVASLLDPWLPHRLAESLVEQAGLSPGQKAAEFSRAARQQLVRAVKGLAIPATGTLGFEKAEVTAGGVALDEVDSRTLRSKRVPGLFIAGEFLDLDGPIGGYNLQAAFSTGYLAGENV
jgi:hypothetical protein